MRKPSNPPVPRSHRNTQKPTTETNSEKPKESTGSTNSNAPTKSSESSSNSARNKQNNQTLPNKEHSSKENSNKGQGSSEKTPRKRNPLVSSSSPSQRTARTPTQRDTEKDTGRTPQRPAQRREQSSLPGSAKKSDGKNKGPSSDFETSDNTKNTIGKPAQRREDNNTSDTVDKTPEQTDRVQRPSGRRSPKSSDSSFPTKSKGETQTDKSSHTVTPKKDEDEKASGNTLPQPEKSLGRVRPPKPPKKDKSSEPVTIDTDTVDEEETVGTTGDNESEYIDEDTVEYYEHDDDDAETTEREDNTDGEDNVSDEDSGDSYIDSSDEKEKPAPLHTGRRKKTGTPASMKKRGQSKKKNYDKNAIIEKYAKDKKPAKKYSHHTEQGTVTARQIQFYKNLNLSYTYDKNKVADLLTPPPDKQETREQRIRRERLIKQAIGGEEALKRNSKLRITPKQVEDMRFLAVFKYANAKQVAKKNAETEDTARKRLNRLRDRGLVLSNKIYGTKPVYFLSQEGMILSGYDYKTLMKNDINLSTLSHTFGLNHIASCLHGAVVDVLDFNGAGETWPTKNRRYFDEKTMRYKTDYGENIVSEYEIQSYLSRRRQNIKGDIYKPAARADIKTDYDIWKRELQEIKDSDDKQSIKRRLREHVYSSPEMMHENQWMWTLFPDNPPTLVHHVPDLVVKRPRNLDGSPNSIAVELELTAKNSDESYVKTLTAYLDDQRMYSQVVWVSPTKAIRTKLEKIAKDVGLWESGKIRIIPLYYEDGEWGNNPLWLL